MARTCAAGPPVAEGEQLSAERRVRASARRPGTSAETAADGIRAAVARGELRAGAPVREEEWAGRLSLSRTPVREAINRLVLEGLLVRDGRTAYVFQPSIDDLLDIYDMRIALETLAARRAAERGGPELANGLMERYDRIKSAHRSERTEALAADDDWFLDHEEFHNFLFAGAESPRLSAMIQMLRSQSEPYVRFAVTRDRRLRAAAKSQHREMVTLVRRRDAEGLAALVYEHLMGTRREVVNLIEAGWMSGTTPALPVAPPIPLPSRI